MFFQNYFYRGEQNKLKTRYRLLGVFLALLLIPLIGVAIYISVSLDSYYKNSRVVQINRIVDIVANEAEDYFAEIIQNGKAVISNDDIKEYLISGSGEAAARSAVKAFSDGDVRVVQISVYDAKGKLLPISTNYPAQDNQDVSVTSMELDISEGYGFSSINKYKLEDQSTDIISYVNKFYDGDTLLGYCQQYYNLNFFEELILSSEKSTVNQIMITDTEGKIIREPFDSVISFSELSEFDEAAQCFKDVQNGGKVNFKKFESDGENLVICGKSVKYIKSARGRTWGVLVTDTESSMYGGFDAYSKKLKGIMAVIFIAVSAVAVVLIWRILKPFDDISEILEKFKKGDKKTRYTGGSKTRNMNAAHMGSLINYMLDSFAESEDRYKAIVEMTDNIVFEYNVPKNSVVFSDNFNSKFSFRAKTLRFEDSFFANGIVQRRDRAKFEGFVDRLLEGEAVQGEFCFKTIYNDYAWYIVRSVSIRDHNGNVTKIIGTMIDIDRAKRREESLLKKANYDSLTNVFNRETFEISLMNEYDLSQMRKSKIAVLFIDLDDFRFYNNNYGHALGDEALVFVAGTLKELVGTNGFVGRYGGDEFVVCYSETFDAPPAGDLAARIIEELGRGFDGVFVERHFSVKCSIGIAYLSDMSMDAESVIKDADEAMYSVKKNGKSDYSYYTKPR